MPFNPSIPQPLELQNDSQPELLSNNIALDSSFSNDHTLFSNATANNGFHKQVTLYQVATDPAQTFPSSKIYSKNVGSTPNQVTNLYFSSKPETGVDVVRQLTGNILTESGNDGQGGTYNYFLTPWGLKIFTGSTQSFSGSMNFTLSGATTFGPTIYTQQATAFGGGSPGSSFTPAPSASTFNITTSNAAPFTWFVITT